MAITADKPRIAEIPTGVKVDPVTLDIIEGALKSARYEMDAVLFRSAMSPVIREQHDEFPMITDPRGRMVVGQFGAYINEMMEEWDRGIYPGDVILTSDPFKCSGSISHTNDWLVLVPIFYDDELIGWASQFGHQMDCGGPLPGSLPTGAKTIFEEGLIIPPIKVVERGEIQHDVLNLILNNATVKTTIAVSTIAASTAYTVGWYYNASPNPTLYVYSSAGLTLPALWEYQTQSVPGGVRVASIGANSATNTALLANLPAATVGHTMGFGITTGTNSAHTLTIDHVMSASAVNRF